MGAVFLISVTNRPQSKLQYRADIPHSIRGSYRLLIATLFVNLKSSEKRKRAHISPHARRRRRYRHAQGDLYLRIFRIAARMGQADRKPPIREIWLVSGERIPWEWQKGYPAVSSPGSATSNPGNSKGNGQRFLDAPSAFPGKWKPRNPREI